MKGLFAIASVVAGAFALVPLAAAQLDEGAPGTASTSLVRPAGITKNPRLESRLQTVASAAPAQALATARRGGLDTANGRVRVMVEGSAARAAVVAAGGTVESAVEGLVEALVPPSALNGLSRARGVDRVRAPFHAVPLGIDSEGVAATSANAWHTAGATGSGAKVAVIDLGFANLAARQASGDLPAGLITQDYCGGSMGAPEPHGTAVAEIVHEMAPDAQLYLICIDTEADLKLAEEYAKTNAITIVNHSVGWFNSGRGDGSGGSTTPDGIVADARAHGILWVNAAGNEAQRHWSGIFSDSDGDTAHNFSGMDQGNSIFLPNGAEVCGFLKWDRWPTTDQDFDLYLVRSSTNTAVAVSFDEQSGAEPPVEALCYTNLDAGQTFFFGIVRFAGSASPRLDLFVTRSNSLEYANAAGSMVEPATSPNAFAAGAICWSNNALEPYSSQGPTIDGRVKPDIAGQAAVSSGIYGAFTACGTSGFTGTSASAPHVAGVAALWKGLMPLSSSDAIRAGIQADALDLGVAGMDSHFGSGKLLLPTATPDAVTQVGASSPTKTTFSAGGTVNPRGVPTSYRWEYGTTDAYGSMTPATDAGSGRLPVAVGTTVTGLANGTVYHFRLVATNLFGTTVGADMTATTLSPMPPTVTTGAASTIGATKATVAGTVNPSGAATTYYVEYGPTLAYGSQTAPVSAGSGVVPVGVNVTLTGLVEGTPYQYRFVATNEDGTTNGANASLTTVTAVAPTATTGAASAIGTASATIAGTVNPGGEDTTYKVEYGLDTAYGSTAPVPAASAGFGSADVPVLVPLSGLTAATEYHYRVVASNSLGDSLGDDMTFTTAAAPPPPPPGGGGGGGGGGGVPPDFTLAIGHGPTNVAAGESFTYTFVIANKTNGFGSGMNLTFTLPDRVEFGGATVERGSGCVLSSGQTYVCFLDFLGGFQSTIVRVAARVRENGELRLTGALTLKERDENPLDNVATYTFTAGPVAPLTPPTAPTAPTKPAAPKGVTKVGTARPDVLRGGAGGDTLRGLGGNDRLFGLGGNDRLFGSLGNDSLYGSLDNDSLFGGVGKDRLDGGKGRDVLDAGAGNDTILARDKAVDTIRCGAGRDVVIADRNDKVARDCETVRRA